MSFEDCKHVLLMERLMKKHIYSINHTYAFREKVTRRIETIKQSPNIIQDEEVISSLLLYTGPFVYRDLNSYMRVNSLALVPSYDFD